MTAIVQVSKTIGVYCPSPLQKGQKAREIAFQKECRDQYLDEGIPSGIDLSLDKSILREISSQKAKEIILKYEWLGRMSATKYHYALVLDNKDKRLVDKVNSMSLPYPKRGDVL